MIFIDEIDAIFRERSSGSEEHDVTRDLKTEFMQLWDGISTSSYDRILVMGATNRPFDIDSAFRRRLVKQMYVGIPNYDDRVVILQKMLSGIPLMPDFNIARIAELTEGYTPSDLKELLRAAALIPLREARISGDINTNSRDSLLRSLATDDVLVSLHRIRPKTWSEDYRQALEDFTNESSNSIIFDRKVDDLRNRPSDFGSDTFTSNSMSNNQHFFHSEDIESSYDFDSDNDDNDML